MKRAHLIGGTLFFAWLGISPQIPLAAAEKIPLPPNPLGISEPGANSETMSGYYVIDGTLYFYDQNDGNFVNLGPAEPGATAMPPDEEKEPQKKTAPSAGKAKRMLSEDSDEPASALKPAARPALRWSAAAMPAQEVPIIPETTFLPTVTAAPPLVCAGWNTPLLPKRFFRNAQQCQNQLLEKADLAAEVLRSERENLGTAGGAIARPKLAQAFTQGVKAGCRCAVYTDQSTP